MLLFVLLKLIGVDETSDDANCVVVILFAFDVFVCSCALEDDVLVVTTADAVTAAVSAATVDVVVLLQFQSKKNK